MRIHKYVNVFYYCSLIRRLLETHKKNKISCLGRTMITFEGQTIKQNNFII